MGSELQENKSFENRMKERIRDSIGELMTDDELSKIISRCVEDIFFKEREIKEGYHTRTEPPFVHKIVEELLTRRVKEQVMIYFGENKDKLLEIVKGIIGKGIGEAVFKAIDQKFQNDLYTFQNNIITTLSQQ